MISILVKTIPRGEVDRSLELPDRSTPLDIFKALDLRPDSWLVIRHDRVLPDDVELDDGDEIRLLSVVSGG